jgi:hypothetical protein
MEVTGSSGPSVPTFKVTWWHPKKGDAFCQITTACDVPGVVAVLAIEGELSRSFTLPQDRTTPHLRLNVSAFLMSSCLMMQMMCGTKAFANPISEPANATFLLLEFC